MDSAYIFGNLSFDFITNFDLRSFNFVEQLVEFVDMFLEFVADIFFDRVAEFLLQFATIPIQNWIFVSVLWKFISPNK